MKKSLIIFLLILHPKFTFSSTLIELVEANNLPAVQEAVQNGADINIADKLGFTPLHIASWNGYIDIVRYLLEKGADPNAVSESGNTPLRFANPAVSTLLKRYGAYAKPEKLPESKIFFSPNIYIEKDNPTPRYKGPTKVISYFTTNNYFLTNNISNSLYIYDFPKKSYDVLIKKTTKESAILHGWDENGNNNIHRAAAEGDLDTIKELIANGINPKSKNSFGDSPLRFAAENKNLKVIQFLMEEHGLDVNNANKDGTTALTFAALNNDTNMIQYLIKMGANMNSASTAFVVKTVNGVKKETIISNWTILMTAAQMGNNQAIKMLINNGADINMVDSDGWNALMFAVQNQMLTTAKLLVRMGSDYNIESSDKHTAMSLAVDNRDKPMIKFLREVKAKPSSVPLIALDEQTIEEQVEEKIEIEIESEYPEEAVEAVEEAVAESEKIEIIEAPKLSKKEIAKLEKEAKKKAKEDAKKQAAEKRKKK